MSNSIKISGLNNLSIITSDDFIPIIDSGSLTTERASISTLNTFLAQSGSSLSASYALSASKALSASYALSGSFTLNARTASFSSTASYVASAIFSTSALSSSWASSSLSASISLTASFISTASFAKTASYLNYPNNSTASFSQNSLSSSYAITASFASNIGATVSASYALTASFVPTSPNVHGIPNFITPVNYFTGALAATATWNGPTPITSSVSWKTLMFPTASVPQTATAVILQALMSQGGPDGVPPSTFYVRASSVAPTVYVAGANQSSGGADGTGNSAQGIFPFFSNSTTRSIQYSVSVGFNYIAVSLIGYIS